MGKACVNRFSFSKVLLELNSVGFALLWRQVLYHPLEGYHLISELCTEFDKSFQISLTVLIIIRCEEHFQEE